MKVLLAGLPPESAVARSALGDRATWQNREELLAVVADRVAELVWLTCEIHRDHKRQPQPTPRPDRIPRPGDFTPGRQVEQRRAPRRRHMTVAEMKQLVAGAQGMVKGR